MAAERPPSNSGLRSLIARLRRLPLVPTVLVGTIAVWLLWVVADAAVSVIRVGSDAVATAPASTTEAPRLEALAGNRLLADTRPAPVSCTLPPFRTDDAGLLAYYRAVVVCMDALWHPLLRAAGAPTSTPSINITARPGATPCGIQDDEDNLIAWYCSRGETMYLPIDRMTKDDGKENAAPHLAMLGHEYGHHVQHLSGMLAEANVKMTGAGVDDQIQRRIELQANCFAAVFLAVAGGRGDIPQRLASSAVDDYGVGFPDLIHGSWLNQRVWTDRGFNRATPAACNTWSAPVGEVN